MEFKHTSAAEGSTLVLSFEGPIDEDAEFPQVDTSKFNELRIDLKGVTAINSVGIREWLDWIKPFADKIQIKMQNCPKSMVFQFNMVDGFLPAKSKVISFYVPYFCENCDREENALFEVGKEVSVANGVLSIDFKPKEAFDCGENTCGMEMDVTEAKYFQFLKRS